MAKNCLGRGQPKITLAKVGAINLILASQKEPHEVGQKQPQSRLTKNNPSRRQLKIVMLRSTKNNFNPGWPKTDLPKSIENNPSRAWQKYDFFSDTKGSISLKSLHCCWHGWDMDMNLHADMQSICQILDQNFNISKHFSLVCVKIHISQMNK